MHCFFEISEFMLQMLRVPLSWSGKISTAVHNPVGFSIAAKIVKVCCLQNVVEVHEGRA